VTNNLHAIVPDFSVIDYVFISHSHFDHFLGLPYFLMGRHLDIIARKKREPEFVSSALHIYLPEGLEELVEQLLQVCHKDVAKLTFDRVYHTVDCSKKVSCDAFDVKAFPVNHTVQTCGFSIYQGEHKLISYSSDTLYDNNIIENFTGSAVLILEGMVPDSESGFSAKTKHATFEQMRNVVEQIRPQKAFMVHLQPRYLKQAKEIVDSINTVKGSVIDFPSIGDVHEVLCV
jgi:ribonuclease BN (tRNA processing enzyme)